MFYHFSWSVVTLKYLSTSSAICLWYQIWQECWVLQHFPAHWVCLRASCNLKCFKYLWNDTNVDHTATPLSIMHPKWDFFSLNALFLWPLSRKLVPFVIFFFLLVCLWGFFGLLLLFCCDFCCLFWQAGEIFSKYFVSPVSHKRN